MMLKPDVHVAGLPFATIAPWGGLQFSTRITGSWEASWALSRQRAHWMLPNHPHLTSGAPVTLLAGSEPIWAGTLTEPDWSTDRLVALGCPRQAEDTLSISTWPNLTTRPNLAIDAAIDRGAVDWKRISNFGTTKLGSDDAAEKWTYLARLLDAYTDDTGHQWHVDPRRRLVWFDPDLTDPDWVVHDVGQQLGYSDERTVDRVMVRYRDSADGLLNAAWWPTTAPPPVATERGISLTPRGQISAAAAETAAKWMWWRTRGEPGFTGGLSLSRGDVVTAGGIVAPLEHVRAGDVMRLMAQPGRDGASMTTTFVIGETDLDTARGALDVRPVGTAARSFSDAVADAWKGEAL